MVQGSIECIRRTGTKSIKTLIEKAKEKSENKTEQEANLIKKSKMKLEICSETFFKSLELRNHYAKLKREKKPRPINSMQKMTTEELKEPFNDLYKCVKKVSTELVSSKRNSL